MRGRAVFYTIGTLDAPPYANGAGPLLRQRLSPSPVLISNALKNRSIDIVRRNDRFETGTGHDDDSGAGVIDDAESVRYAFSGPRSLIRLAGLESAAPENRAFIATTMAAMGAKWLILSVRRWVASRIVGSFGAGAAIVQAVEAGRPDPRLGADAFAVFLSLTLPPPLASDPDASAPTSRAGLFFARTLFEQGRRFDLTLSATEAKHAFLGRLSELARIQRCSGVSAWRRNGSGIAPAQSALTTA